MTGLESWEALRDADPANAARVLDQLKKSVFVPHEGGQATVLKSDARFRVLRAGRRWGKTQLAAHEAIRAALAEPDQMVWWVANNDKNVRRGYRAVIKQLPRMLLAKAPPSDAANDRILHLKNGSTIEFYTAGTPEGLVGEGVNFVVVDEAALIPETVWNQNLRPTLSDTDGRALMISTPRGRNWFYHMWHRGQGSNPLYESWHFPTHTSPYIPDEEIADVRDALPSLEFEQEYLAEFVANAASMFTLPDRAVRPGLVPPEGWVNLGVDLAKKEDFTVVTGSNANTGLPCVFEKWNAITWPEQERLLLGVIETLWESPIEGLTIGVDSTGIGDVVFDHLEEAGLDVVPINFASADIKQRMVRLLASDLEHERAFIIEPMRAEFEHYEYEISKTTGKWKFSAPEGAHDDEVSAKLIEHWVAVHEAPPGIRFHDPALDEAIPVEEPEEPEGAVEVVTPDSPRSIALREGAWA